MTACVEPLATVETPATVEPPGVPDLPFEATAPAEPTTVVVETAPPNNTPPELAQLRAALRGLGEYSTPDHTPIVRALDALADALVVLAPPRDERQRGIDAAARQLAVSQATSELHADVVRGALEDALVVMATGSPRAGRDTVAYEQAVERFRQALVRIDPERPLMPQQRQLHEALAAAVAVLEIAVGLRAST